LRSATPGTEWTKLAENYCSAIRRAPPNWSYCQFSEEVLKTRDAVLQQGGPALVAAFHRYTILRLVPESWRSLLERPHLAPMLEWFEDAVARMVSDIDATPDADLDFQADRS